MFTLSDLTPDFLTRFYAKIMVDPDSDCWPWVGGHDTYGFPIIRIGGSGYKERASRIAFAIHNKSLPGLLTIKQSCGNRDCMKGEHLKLNRPFHIKDEFTDLDCSRERKRQLRKMSNGLCCKPRCMERLAGDCYCIAHMIEETERQRIRKGTVKRNRCLTYHFQDFRNHLHGQGGQPMRQTVGGP